MALPTNDTQEVIGIDIDEVNVAWCTEHLRGHGEYRLGGLAGFDLPDGSVDLLYGISVMTHLSEHHQHLWLREIRRVLRPGGCAILTINGEPKIYLEPQMVSLPFVEKFGFFDGIPDARIGEERDTYYRATYHRRDYLRHNWGEYFEIVDVIPSANAFRQDFVVLRRPG